MTTRRELRFLDVAQPCRRCGEPALTVRIGGRVPMHMACDPKFWLAVATPEQTVAAISVLVATLGPVLVVLRPTKPPASSTQIGPCTLCSALTRRYGDDAAPRCWRCQGRP